MHRLNAFSHTTCALHTALHTLSKNTNLKFFLSNMISHWSLIHRNFSQFHTRLKPKVVFQELSHVLEIPKYHFIFKKSFVYRYSDVEIA